MKNNKSLIFILILLFASVTFSQESSQNPNLLESIGGGVPISVTIGGEFITTGSFPALSGERLDQFVTRIYNTAKSRIVFPTNDKELFLKLLAETEQYALRGIKLKRIDGTVKNIDLLKFRLTGEFSNNPYLENDDVIIFPQNDEEYGFVDVSGAVNKPTKFQFVQGDKLSDAVYFARGINKAYEKVDSALISRLSYDGSAEEQIKVAIKDDFDLIRGDRIKVLANQTKRKDYKVLVLGEVNNPGNIYITDNNTTLKEVIKKAGGFTANASLKQAEIVRNFTKQQILLNLAINKQAEEDPSVLLTSDKTANIETMKEYLRMNRAADLFTYDTLFFNISNRLRILEGETRIDFRELDSANSMASQFIVKNGDVIIVPQKFEAVYVFGQVGLPGYYNYLEGQDYLYYINKAGGLTSTAKDDDEIYVIKSKGREWINIDEDDYKIEPGDYIYVLKEIPRDTWYYVYRIGTVAGIVGSIATLVLLFK